MHCRAKKLLAALSLALGLVVGAAAMGFAAIQPWSDVSPDAIAPSGERVIIADHFRALALDPDAIRAVLADVPLEGTAAAASRAEVDLPMPNGGFARFSVVESPVMAPELQAQFPEIRTYAGYGVGDPSLRTRFDLTPDGFHALIFTTEGTIYIDPFQRGDVLHYQSYYRRDFQTTKTMACGVVDDVDLSRELAGLAEQVGERSGAQLRTYRLALAADGEYTAYFGGTVDHALAAMTTTMNRVDGVYEEELSIRLVMIANETAIIYTNAATDPYTNNDGYTMLSQNQSNLDSVIGSANYDIGHVLSTGGGGIAGLGVVCEAGAKAQGVTGSPAPVGDAFDIDYVAHEMGHQFGGTHNFNGNAGNCGGGNRYGPAAYEPGSGSTIMGYAGICGAHNLQMHSDDYFNWVSTAQIVSYSTTGWGNQCPVTTATGVIDPVPNAGTGGFAIPLNTPFTLTGSATTTGTATYCWEESDLGAACPPNSPTGNAPTFRSYPPVSVPYRTFPKMTDLVNNYHRIGETLATYARGLTFKFTVRDFQTGGVGIAKGSLAITVASSGPFAITSPTTLVDWPEGSQQTVTWDVAGSDAAPVNCHTVDIVLSTDGGSTFATVLAAGTPNDGSEAIVLPMGQTNTARMMVRAADNVFFDISNANFHITQGIDAVGPMTSPSGLALSAGRPNPFGSETTITFRMPRAGEAMLRVYDPAGRLVQTILSENVAAGSHQVSWDGSDASGRQASSGVYLYKLTALGETLTGRMTLVR